MTTFQTAPLSMQTFLHGDHLDVAVRELMTADVISVGEDATLRQVSRTLHRHQVHAALVLRRSDGRPLGWVTMHGLAVNTDADSVTMTAKEVITEKPIWISPSAKARDALALMRKEGVSHLFVSERPLQPPRGVISETDIARLAAL